MTLSNLYRPSPPLEYIEIQAELPQPATTDEVIDPVPIARSVNNRVFISPLYMTQTTPVTRGQIIDDTLTALRRIYGDCRIFGSPTVTDFPEQITEGSCFQVSSVLLRGDIGFDDILERDIWLYPNGQLTPPPAPVPILEEIANVNAPFVEGNLWQQSLGVTAVFAEPLTAPVFNSNWTRNAGVNSRDFLVTNDPITTTEAIRLDAAGGVTRVPGLFDGPVGSGGGGGGAAILGPGGGGGVTLNGYISNVVTGDFLENLAKRLSISTEVSRDRDNLVVKTSLFLERDDTSLITVDSFEGHIDIDELKD